MFELLYIGSIFCALLTIYILLFKDNAIRSYSNYILALILLLEIYFVSIYLLIYSGFINEIPILYKTAAPLNYLIPPFAFLYVKSVLSNKKGLALVEYLHFLPFVLASINYFPFFIMPIEQKKVIVQMTSDDISYALKYQAGIFPETYLYVLKLLQTLVYLFFQWRLIFLFKKENINKTIEDQIKRVIKWLKAFTWIFTFILIGFFFLASLYYITSISLYSQIMYVGQSLLLSVSFFSLSSYLLINPGILDGLPFIKYWDKASNNVEQVDVRPFILENYEPEIIKLENYMRDSLVYLNPRISLTQIAASLSIPIKDLSFILNNHFKLRYNDYINKYRVEHFLKLVNESQLDNYTIDAIIQMSGFASKSTFHSAFRKIHHCTPSQFLAKNLS